MLKTTSIIIIALVLIFAGVVFYERKNTPELIDVEIPPAQEFEEFIEESEIVIEVDAADDPAEDMLAQTDTEDTEPEVLGKKIEEEPEVILADINLAVPFTSQAPTAEWNEIFNDACEEASVLMVDYYYNGQIFLDPKSTEELLVDMVKWQEANWGGHFDLTMAELAEYTQTTFGYETELIEDLTIEKIKAELNYGRPVIVPADGKKLDNPFFSGDGPTYHMLVIKGYTGENFITNDPGTKRGEDFVYTFQNLMDSIADWDKQKAQTVGPKIGLVLYKS